MKTINEICEDLIKVYAELIENAKSDGHIKMAIAYKNHLDTVLAMTRIMIVE